MGRPTRTVTPPSAASSRARVPLCRSKIFRARGSPRPRPPGFGREEGPSLPRVVRGQTGPVVHDQDVESALPVVDDLDLHPAPAFVSGLGGVSHQVLERALEELLVPAQEQRLVAPDQGVDDVVSAPQLPCRHPPKEERQVELREIEALLANELVESPHHGLQGLALVSNAPGGVGGGGAGLGSLDESRVAHDGPQSVAHLVHDSRGELPRPRERFFLPHRLLQPLPLDLVAGAHLLAPIPQQLHRLLIGVQRALRRA